MELDHFKAFITEYGERLGRPDHLRWRDLQALRAGKSTVQAAQETAQLEQPQQIIGNETEDN